MLNIRKIEKEINRSSGEVVAVFKHSNHDRYILVHMGCIGNISEKYKEICFINLKNIDKVGLLGYLKILSLLGSYLIYSNYIEIIKVKTSIKCKLCDHRDAQYKVKSYGEVEEYFCRECATELHIV